MIDLLINFSTLFLCSYRLISFRCNHSETRVPAHTLVKAADEDGHPEGVTEGEWKLRVL